MTNSTIHDFMQKWNMPLQYLFGNSDIEIKLFPDDPHLGIKYQYGLLDFFYRFSEVFWKHLIKDWNQFKISLETYLKSFICKVGESLEFPKSKLEELRNLLSFEINEKVNLPHGKRGHNINCQVVLKEITGDPKNQSKIYKCKKCRSIWSVIEKMLLSNSHANIKIVLTRTILKLENILWVCSYSREYKERPLIQFLCYLMLCEGLELFLLYDPNDTKRPFTITDAIITHQNIRKGCVVFSISEILCKALMIKVLDPYTADLVKFYENNNKRWLKVRISIHQAISYLDKYVFSFSVQNGQPTYGDVKFTNPNIKFFNRLKKYVGVFGFVVSIIGSWGKKILRGERKLKFK